MENNQHSENDGRPLVADWDALMRTFIQPESAAARSTLIKYMEQILFGLHDFLKAHVGITEETSLKALAARFTETRIRQTPEKKLADVITDLMEDIAPRAVNVASPYFVGHMTSALPFFMVHLKAIIAALNQNVVKLETSKVVSVVEKQVTAKIHRMIFGRSEAFYRAHVQNTQTCLGGFVEDGTLANYTALWVARNRLLGPFPGFDGVEKQGIHAAFRRHGIDRCVVLVSGQGHYSLQKACGLLGLGSDNLLAVATDHRNRVRPDRMARIIRSFAGTRTRVLAVVGIAGTTETGAIDPLRDLASICADFRIHFHVDAAWGGPTLMSKKYAHLLDGIQGADSVTIDGHKQFYMPMSCGMVYFKDPAAMDAVVYHARYINRPGSVDLGIRSISGSREASSLILHATLKIMGTQGYALLLEHGIDTARHFAREIERRDDFELISPPELNILTYRLHPGFGSGQSRSDLNRLNEINRTVQRRQREAGNSFVSRTTLTTGAAGNRGMVVLRCVIMNPMTTPGILREILDEQEAIYRRIEAETAPGT
jgi:putative pyridoxal-dependent aspartate 1-decarboxylase